VRRNESNVTQVVDGSLKERLKIDGLADRDAVVCDLELADRGVIVGSSSLQNRECALHMIAIIDIVGDV
jgi:hypothetical protein